MIFSENPRVEQLEDDFFEALVHLAGERGKGFPFFEVLVHDAVGVGFLDASVPDLIRVDDHVGAVVTAAEAHVGAHLDVLEAIPLHAFLEAVHDLLTAANAAIHVHADKDIPLVSQTRYLGRCGCSGLMIQPFSFSKPMMNCSSSGDGNTSFK